MDEQPQKQKQKRIRRKRLDLQLEQALRDAEAAMTADGATKYLMTTRLNILNQQIARDRNEKLNQALAEVKRLTADNEGLKAELAAKPTARPMTDIDRVLAKYEEEQRRNDANN
jgi:predicted transcriptional regulator